MIAIGEIGLDYYYSADNKAFAANGFADQIRIANEVDKPVIIHTRSAPEDTIAMLREHQAEKVRWINSLFYGNLGFCEKGT